MVQLGAIIASHAVSEYRVMLGGALNVGVTPVEAREIVYQAVPYVGMAKVFDFLHVTNEVLLSRGIELPCQGSRRRRPRRRMQDGLAVQKRLLGEKVEQLYAQSPKDQLHIQRFLSANCFGDFLTRTGLELKTRELLTFSMLASLGGCEPQLAGHLAANLAIGNDRKVLVSLVTRCCPSSATRARSMRCGSSPRARHDERAHPGRERAARAPHHGALPPKHRREADALPAARQPPEQPDPKRVTIVEGDVLDPKASRRRCEVRTSCTRTSRAR